MKIGIIGLGIVGGTIKQCFEHIHEIFVHDPVLNSSMADVTSNCEMAYIAVPTPSDESGRCDTSIVEDVLRQLPEGFTAVIKSTIIPGTTENLQQRFPNLKIAYSPEFLVERNRIEDFKNQKILVVGTAHQDVAELVKEHHVSAGVLKTGQFFHTSATEAEMVKYTKNNFYAMKVIFANQIYDICQKLSVDYDTVKQIITSPQDQIIGESHLEPIMGLRRGFGGKCLPKDTLALQKLAIDLDIDYELLTAIQNDNSRLREIVTGKPSDVETEDD